MNALSKKAILCYKPSLLVEYSVAFGTGLLIGFGAVPKPVIMAAIAIAILLCIKHALDNDLAKLFTVVPYLCYTEIYVRDQVFDIPYLYMTYLFIAVFIILLVRQKKTTGMHSRAFIFLWLYFLLEVLDAGRAKDIVYFKLLTAQSACLAIAATWASFNYFSPPLINKLLDHLKAAGISLCGFIAVAHIRGGINYSLTSSSDASNGLAPVQISGYLGFTCILFFLSIMNNRTIKELMTNGACFIVAATVMLLTLSRGGLYFVAIVTALYILFNRSSVKNYYLCVLLIPVGLFIYSYVTFATEGMIEERYQEEGTSGRDELIKAGFTLFSENMVTGIGTANYNAEIKEQELYGFNSGAHNEFVRAAAEHGIAGIITYWGFYIVLLIEVLARKKIEREYSLYFLALFCMIIVHNGLKISIQFLLLLMAVALPSVIKLKKGVPAAA